MGVCRGVRAGWVCIFPSLEVSSRVFLASSALTEALTQFLCFFDVFSGDNGPHQPELPADSCRVHLSHQGAWAWMGQSYALARAVSPSQPVSEFLTYQYVAFFCQMTLFNGLRFPYIYLTSVSLMIPCFDPIQAPHALLCIYSFPSQFFPLLATSCHTYSPSYSPAHAPPILPFPVPRSARVSFSHVDCKLLEDLLLGWKHGGPSLVNGRCINAVEKVYCRKNRDYMDWRLREDGICLFPWLAELNWSVSRVSDTSQ